MLLQLYHSAGSVERKHSSGLDFAEGLRLSFSLNPNSRSSSSTFTQIPICIVGNFLMIDPS